MLFKYIFVLFCMARLALTAPNLIPFTQSVAARDSPINGNSTALPPIPSNIAAIAGPPLVGIILNWFLYGILVMQIYVYYQWFPDDRKGIKCLVYGLFILDTVQSVLGTADAFHWLAKGYGNLFMLSDPFISPFDVPIVEGIIAFIVQTFFCWRIWVLQKSRWLPSAVFMVVVASFAGAIATSIGAFQVANLTLLDTLKWQLSLWLGGSALSDTLIAIIMTVLLLQSRSGQHQHSDNVLVRIVRLTVETNAVTASVAIAVLVFLLAIPTNPSISIAPAYALGKLYSNTLLAVFNNRVYMNSRGIFPRSSRTVSSTGVSFVKFRPTHLSSSRPQTNTEVTVETHTESYHMDIFRKAQSIDGVHLSTVDKPADITNRIQDNN